MPTKKIVCLGGGSLYFRRAIPDLLLSTDLSGSQIVLYDIDAEKVAKMAQMGQRLAEKAGTDFRVRSTDNLADAVDGADFAISSIGGSGAEVSPNVYDSYYQQCYIRIPEKYGIHQVVGDTCGPGGMMMALRSLAAYMPICREMEKRCPRAILFNHSNPMAVICRAIHKYTNVNAIGICHGVQHGICCVAEILDVPPQQLECTWIGTNHYYWFLSIRHKGTDVYAQLMQRLENQPPSEGRQLATRLSLIYGRLIVYPEDDHIWEFYPFATGIGASSELPYDLPKAVQHFRSPNARVGPDAGADERREFLEKYQSIVDDTQLPTRQGDMITGEGIAALLSAIAVGRRKVAIVNIPNRGLIPNLSADAVVEVEGVTDSAGVRGIYVGDAPTHLKGILEKRFAWQELVADAAVTGDRNLALQALLLDEMAILPDKAEAMLDEMLAASGDLLPQFKS